MKEVIGNLFENPEQFDVIVHGCNCFSTMGAGVAKTVKALYPQAYLVDKNSEMTPIQKLGKITDTSGLTTPIIVNAYTQYQWKGKNNFDYDAIKACMKRVRGKFSGKKIGMPMIGAGLAGGDWIVIRQIIITELKDEDVTVVKLK
jgi:O-acetyl-ADP-ribose deacetylase (regulator of RNase III)